MAGPFLLSLIIAAAPVPAGDEARARELMALGAANLAETAGIRAARRIDPKVIEALRKVPRHLFVPEEMRPFAYENRPLPIGHDQTISQPSIVALMTHLLDVEPDQSVLEIGTGSGYQAAVLAQLGAEVRSIEIVEPLGREAAARLDALGYEVEVRIGDGYAGWPEAAPYDRIIVTAGAPHVPEPLVAQLKPGGRMVIPVRRGEAEELMLVRKDAKGRVTRRALLPVRFVPLIRAGE